MKTKIDGVSWTVTRRRSKNRKDAFGETNYTTKTVYIEPELEVFKLLEIVVHEVLHASGPNLDEHFVTQFAKDASRIYRRLLKEELDSVKKFT